MRISRPTRTRLKGATILFALALVGPVHAFDGAKPLSVENATPMEAFRYGFQAYREGDAETAVDALKFAASKGSAMAQWKLGRMYAEGDGVQASALTAFEFFREVATSHADDDPKGSESPFVANAFVELGGYFETGIPGTYVGQNPSQARQIYAYAASYFADPNAQYRLAKMYLDGRGGERNPKQAARWLKLSAEKGHVLAQSELGRILFFGEGMREKRKRGLKWLTIALDRAVGTEAELVRRVHEQAFSLASEKVRRSAVKQADAWLVKNPLPLFETSEPPETLSAMTDATPTAVVVAPLEPLTADAAGETASAIPESNAEALPVSN